MSYLIGTHKLYKPPAIKIEFSAIQFVFSINLSVMAKIDIGRQNMTPGNRQRSTSPYFKLKGTCNIYNISYLRCGKMGIQSILEICFMRQLQ